MVVRQQKAIRYTGSQSNRGRDGHKVYAAYARNNRHAY